MTLQADASGSQRYIPPAFQPGADLFGLAKPPQIAPQRGALGPAHINIVPVGEDYPGLYYYRWEVYDLGGTIRQRGRIDNRDHASKASSTLDTSYEEQAVLPAITNLSANTNPTTASVGYQGIMSASAFGKFAVGVRGTAQTYLFIETSTTNPLLSQRTYAKGATMVSLTTISLSTTTYLAVGLDGAAINLLTDLASTPTEAGSMHANTNVAYGVIQTELPGRPLLIKAGTKMYSLPGDASIGDAPPVVMSNVPTGGGALGLQSLAGGPVRAYWIFRQRYSSTLAPSSSDTLDSDFEGYILSTNQGGTDPQILKMPLTDVHTAAIVRDGIVATNREGDRAIFHNGRFIKDLGVLKDFPANSDRKYVITGFWVKDSDLYANIDEIASPNGTGNTIVYKLKYNWDLDTWDFVSSQYTSGATNRRSFVALGSLPVSPFTGNLHNRVRGGAVSDLLYQFQPPPGVSLYGYRKTSGATATTGTKVEPSGVTTLPEMVIPGFEGYWFNVERVIGPPVKNIGLADAAATTRPNVSVAVAGKTARFDDTSPQPFTGHVDVHSPFVQTIQPVITVTQQAGGTDSTLTNVNMLPIAFEGYAVKSPIDIPSNWKDAGRSAR